MLLLIIREDTEQITRQALGIITSLRNTTKRIKIDNKVITDKTDKTKIKCNKVLLLVTTRSNSLEKEGKSWIEELPKIKGKQEKFRVVLLENGVPAEPERPKTSASTCRGAQETSLTAETDNIEPTEVDKKEDDPDQQEGLSILREEEDKPEEKKPKKKSKDKKSKASNKVVPKVNVDVPEPDKTVVRVKDFGKEVFEWWPKVLEFVFGRETFGGILQDLHQNAFRFYTIPNVTGGVKDYLEINNPLVKSTKNLLESYEQFRVPISKKHIPCILICSTTHDSIPTDLRQNLDRKTGPVYTLALRGTTFSKEIRLASTKTFSTYQILDFIFTLLAGLKVIRGNVKRPKDQEIKISNFVPSELQSIALVLGLLTLPALILQLLVAMIFLWPLGVVLVTKVEKERVYYINWGFSIVAVFAVIWVIITENIWYPEASVIPVSVYVGIYMLVWQLAVHWLLYLRYGYTYGIFSIPLRLIKESYRQQRNSVM